MDRATLVQLHELLQRAAAEAVATGFARESIRLTNADREQIRLAGELLVERAAERFPTLDPYVSSNPDGTITLVLDSRKTR